MYKFLNSFATIVTILFLSGCNSNSFDIADYKMEYSMNDYNITKKSYYKNNLICSCVNRDLLTALEEVSYSIARHSKEDSLYLLVDKRLDEYVLMKFYQSELYNDTSIMQPYENVACLNKTLKVIQQNQKMTLNEFLEIANKLIFQMEFLSNDRIWISSMDSSWNKFVEYRKGVYSKGYKLVPIDAHGVSHVVQLFRNFDIFYDVKVTNNTLKNSILFAALSENEEYSYFVKYYICQDNDKDYYLKKRFLSFVAF